MKQNGQWLSQVRTRSNTALSRSRPSDAPGGLLDQHELLEPATADFELDGGLVGLDLVPDDVAHHLAVEREQLVAGKQPGGISRRAGRDRHHAGGRHPHSLRAQIRDILRRPRFPVARTASSARPATRSGDAVRGVGCGGYPRRMTVERVLLAQPRGFCAGVEMAIKALSWMVRVFEPPVYCYHEIVHNRLVVDRFRELGVVFVDDVDDVPEGAPLMLSAHGSAPEVVAAARDRNRFVVDAVCPLVTKVHHEAKVRAAKGFTVLYVGHRGHDEASGTLAVAPDAIRLVEHEDDLDQVLRHGRRPVAGRVAGADHAVDARLGRRDGSRPGPVPRPLDRSTRRPVLRDHEPSGGAPGDRGGGRRDRGDRECELVEHAGAGQGGDRGRVSGGPAHRRPRGTRRRRAGRRPDRRRHRGRERARRPRAGGDRAARADRGRRARARHRGRRVLPATARSCASS